MQGRKVGIVMGSASDMPIAEKAFAVLDKFGIERTGHVISAHRTPERAAEFARGAEAAGYGVIIAIAGKAAHLAGVLAAGTTLPVIGVPVKGSDLGGMDALLSTVQMPSGVPVACVAIDGGANAAYLAARMLALTDGDIAVKLKKHAEEMAEAVIKADAELFGEE